MKKKQLSNLIVLLFFWATPEVLAGVVQDEYQDVNKSEDEIVFGYYIQNDDISFFGDKIDIIRNKTNLEDGVNIPRARFSVNGKTKDWLFSLSYDAAQEELRNAFLSYNRYNQFRITFGQYKIPYSFWFLTSHSEIDFLEFGLPTHAFEPGFRIGIQAQYFLDPLTFTLGVVAPDTKNTIHNVNVKGKTPLAGNARITFSPIHSENKAVHFAAAAILQDSDSLGQFRFRSFPEVQTYHNKFLVDTRLIYDCKNYFGQEYEVATIFGPLNIVGEYYHTGVNRTINDLTFEGYFISANYFLTGEHYIYNFKRGDIDDTSKIRHWYGAWQIAVRYSKLDLEDYDIKGGRERNTTFGLNWLMNDHVKFVANYIIVKTFPSDNGLDRNVKIFGLRCQLSSQSF